MRVPGATRRSAIGLDVGGRLINAVQLQRQPGGWRVEAAVSMRRQAPGTEPGPDEFSRAAAVLARQGFTGRDVVVAVPHECLLTGVVEVPQETARAAVGQIARAELAGAHDCQPQGLEVACWSMPRTPRAGEPRRLLAAGCTSEAAEAFIDTVEAGGWIVRALDIRSAAVARACAPKLRGEPGPAGVFRLDWSAGELAVVSGGDLVYERTLPEFGLQELHAELASKFHLDPEVVDYLVAEIGLAAQLPDGAAAPAAVLDAVRSRITGFLQKVAAELRRSLTYASREYVGEPAGRVMLHGEAASVPGLTAHLSEALGLDVSGVAPADLAPQRSSLGAVCAQPALTAAFGLAGNMAE